MWIINGILLIVGTLAAAAGIGFYIRNKEAVGKIRFYILSCGIFTAIWCYGYGIVGITPDLELCGYIRMGAVLGICGFLTSETFLVTELSGVRNSLVNAGKFGTVIASITDFFIYSERQVDTFVRVEGRTTWFANPACAINRKVHLLYMLFMFLLMISFAIVWIRNSKLKRLRHFLFMIVAANLLMTLFSIPDTFITAMGGYAVPTSGIGAALCSIVMWYGAIQLNFFDIRTGNVKDRVFDFMEAGIIVFDVNRRISLLNNYAGRLIEDQGDKEPQLSDFLVIGDKEREEMFREARDDIYAERFPDRDGKKTYAVRLKAVNDDYGDLFYYMCVFMDVTEEVETAARLEIASRAKSRFLAQMSHEIRTPINAVLGMNEMILRESKDGEIRNYATNIESAGKTLLFLINSILDFSKIEDGKMELVPVTYDTASFINDLYHSIIQRAEAKDLSFVLEADENLPRALVGDNVRFSQVIMNLLTNAVKYTEKGGVTLTLREESRKGNKVRIYVAVKDTGIGIREEDRDRLFISFERLDKVRNHSIEGTGLGISIIKSILSMMGSTLELESTYGKGSVFSFTVEQEIADETPIGDYEKRLRESGRQRKKDDLISAPNAKVLVVDDNDMNLKVAANLLKLCGIRSDLATSGEETISKMRQNIYDIVLLDYMMPKMDGVETLNKLKEEQLIPENTAMIVLTANAVVGARESYLAAGFRDYLSKPMEVKQLVEKLKAYLPEEAYQTKEEPGRNTADSGFIMEFAPISEIEEEERADREYDLEMLSSRGVDVEAGLNYCADHRTMYYELLSDFTLSWEREMEKIDGFYREENWQNYEVKVHAFKSNVRIIGFTDLAEQAKKLEEAAGKRDVDYIRNNHDHLRQVSEEVVEMIEEAKR